MSSVTRPVARALCIGKMEDQMLKLLGGTIGFVFLVGLVVVVGIVMLIF